MDIEAWDRSVISEVGDVEYELDTSYPRLNSDFYHNLRGKYPRAFRRRSMSASMSDVSSVCSEVITPRSHRAMLSPRSMTPRGHTEEGRPPRPPSRHGGPSGDMGIVGVPRPRHRNRRLHRGMLNSSQYSSTLSIYSEMVDDSRNVMYRSDSMVSLRERLLDNQKSWDSLLVNDPTKKLRERGSQLDLSTVGLSPRTGDITPQSSSAMENNNDSFVLSSEHCDTDKAKLDRLRELEISLEKMAAGMEAEESKLTSTQPLHIDVHVSNSKHHRTSMDSRVLATGRQLASPDSHDSAVEVDSASLPSDPASDNNTQNSRLNGSQPAERSVNMNSSSTPPQDNKLTTTIMDSTSPRAAPIPTQDSTIDSKSWSRPPTPVGSTERPSRARSRTPKLKSRGASPLLNTQTSSATSSVNGDVTPRSRAFSPEQGILSTAKSVHSENMKNRSILHKNYKDSDADSGISQPTGRRPILIESSEPFYLTDDDTNSVIFVNSSSAQDLHPESLTTSPPYQAHNGHTRSRGATHRQNSQVTTPRSRSNDRKREVKFEDEVFGNHSLDRRHRTVSQPVLNGSATGLKYDDVLADYGVPPGFDFEQYSDVTHGRMYKGKGKLQIHNELDLARNHTPLIEDEMLVVVPPRKLPSKVPPPPPPYGSQSDLSVHQLAPVVAPPRTKHRQQKLARTAANIDKPPRPKQVKKTLNETNLQTVTSVSELELDQELASYSSCMEDIDFDDTKGKKKSKLPWKKNKGRFTPTKELDKLHKTGGLSRSSSRTSLASSFTSEAPSEISVVKRTPSRERNQNDLRLDLSSLNDNIDGCSSSRSMSGKPPPAPKPKHLAKLTNSHSETYQSPSQSLQKKPPPPPKPQVSAPERNNNHRVQGTMGQKPLSNSKPPIAQKPPSTKKSNVTNTEIEKQNTTRTSRQNSKSDYAEIPVVSSSTSEGRVSRNRFSGYEDVDLEESDEDDRILSENPYESVVIQRNMHRDKRMSGLIASDSETSSEDESDVVHEAAVDVPEDPDEYASVDYSKKTHRQTEEAEEEVEYINYDEHFHGDDDDDDDNGPPLPDRSYNSNLQNSKELSDSRNSLFNRMDSLKQSAKKKFSKLKRALSMERVDKTGEEGDKHNRKNSQEGGMRSRRNSQNSVPASPTTPEHQSRFKRSPSLKSLTDAFGFVKKIRERKSSGGGNTEDMTPEQRKPPRAPTGSKKTPSISSPEMPETPQNFRPIGNIKTVHKDGSQVLELNKPPHGPFGFYIARGNAKYNHGILVSRLSDALPESFYAGLLAVGDEILEINAQEVKSLPLEEVYDLMASNDKLTLRTLPYAIREHFST